MFNQGASFSAESVFRISLDVFVRKNPDGSVILMLTSNADDKFFRITGVAAEIFNLIDGQASIAKIIESVKGNYKVDVSRIAADAEPFLEKLLKDKIITV